MFFLLSLFSRRGAPKGWGGLVGVPRNYDMSEPLNFSGDN